MCFSDPSFQNKTWAVEYIKKNVLYLSEKMNRSVTTKYVFEARGCLALY